MSRAQEIADLLAGVTITTADNNPQLTLKSTDADANVGPLIDMIRDSSSPADGDELGRIRFKGDDDGGNETTYAYLQVKINDATDASDDGELEILTRTNGNNRSRIELLPLETVFNEDSQDIDFRVESNGNANMLTVNAGDNRVGIGCDPERDFHVKGAANDPVHFKLEGDASDYARIMFDDGTDDDIGEIRYDFGSDFMQFTVNAGEAFRVDNSKNLLIGKAAAGIGTEGIELRANDDVMITQSGDTCLYLNRLSDNGTLIDLRKAGSTFGLIGTVANAVMYLGSFNTGLVFEGFFDDSIVPFSPADEGIRDDAIDLGYGSSRFDDIFATNTSITTSDETEKQQIATLTSAEMTAAKAISALFKTYKWNKSVTNNGDAARTHTGVIAQEVQTAMSNAGLDETKYAFWCSNTWWETTTELAAVEAVAEVAAVYDDDDNLVSPAVMGVQAKDASTRVEQYHTEDAAPEGATKRTRLGVRYPELLAFVGAATEQRLADIETRLTALEAG